MDKLFKFITDIDIRIGDINYGGHLGNDRYLSVFHDARIRYLKRMGCSELNFGGNVALIMSESHVNYKAESVLGDVLKVGVRISDISRIKFKMDYYIERVGDEKLIATGYTLLAGFNYETRKITPFADDVIKRIKEFEEL